MNHADHVRLLRDALHGAGGRWADLGSGQGAFTLALADLLGPKATIYSIDKDAGALARQEQAMRARFARVEVAYLRADFSRPLALPPLDGVLMANSLHFVRDKALVLRLIHDSLKPGGQIVLVEYNTDSGNPWVPYPLAFPTWVELAARCGFVNTRQLAAVPSRFLGEFYSAQSWKPADPRPQPSAEPGEAR